MWHVSTRNDRGWFVFECVNVQECRNCRDTSCGGKVRTLGAKKVRRTYCSYSMDGRVAEHT